MTELLEKLLPNVFDYSDRFLSSCSQTIQMFFLSGGFTFLFGLAFGVILTVTKKQGIKQNLAIFYLVDTMTNIFRSIPFIILLIFLIPFTRIIVGTAISVKGAVVPLIFGAVPFLQDKLKVLLQVSVPEK